ncbi:MAG: SulP family inorganic anion transporter, partial [Cyanobacteria bacterium P01_H01_bin.121]
WLLVRGALTVMTGRSLTLLNLTWFCQAAVSVHWLAGLAIALLLLGIGKRWRHPLVLPGTLLAATAVFFCVLWLSGLPLATARAQGWLLGPFPQGQLWQPLSFSDYSQIHWGAIAHQGGTLGLLVLVSFLSLVLTNNGIELALERDLDLNRELQAVGIANFVAGCGSSMAGNQALPSTILVHKMGAANRLSGCLKAVPCCVVLALGPTFLAYFPRPILGSLLLFLGLELLWQWLVKGWHKFSRFDYCTVLATLLAIACSGLMSGIAIGLSLSVLQFLYRSARLPIIATTVQDPDPGGAELLSVGSKLEVIPLQGALFFGNAAHLFEQLHVKITTPTQIALTQVAPTHCAEESAPKQYLLLDLTNVLDIDASARLALNKLLSLAQHHQTMILYVGLAESLKQPSTFHEDLCASSSYCQVFDTVEQAQTWLHSHATTITASVSQTTEAAVLRHPSQVIG